jgi:hypothetical protein
MKRKSKPNSSTSASASPTPTHLVQEHQGLCILALPASFRSAVPAERWDEIHRELHAQIGQLLTQEEFILEPRGGKGDARNRAATRSATSKKGASRA